MTAVDEGVLDLTDDEAPPDQSAGLYTHADWTEALAVPPDPGPLDREAFDALAPAERTEWMLARDRWHRGMLPTLHRQLEDAATEYVDDLLAALRTSGDELPGLAVSGESRSGKTTFVRATAHLLESRLRGLATPVPGALPLHTAKVTPRQSANALEILRVLYEFFYCAPTGRKTQHDLLVHVRAALRRCGTTVIFLDDAHNVAESEGWQRQALELLRTLQSDRGREGLGRVAIVVLGVKLERWLPSSRDDFSSLPPEVQQFAARFPLTRFGAYADDVRGRSDFIDFVINLEDGLRLIDAHETMLTRHAAELWQHSGGSAAVAGRIVLHAVGRAIEAGEECVRLQHLERSARRIRPYGHS